MTYGKWKALQPHKEKAEPVVISGKVCEICGREIPIRGGGSGSEKKYTCSPECAEERHRRRAASTAKKRREMPVPVVDEVVCVICGKVTPRDRYRRYTCSGECSYKRHLDRVKQNYREKKARMMADGKI